MYLAPDISPLRFTDVPFRDPLPVDRLNPGPVLNHSLALRTPTTNAPSSRIQALTGTI